MDSRKRYTIGQITSSCRGCVVAPNSCGIMGGCNKQHILSGLYGGGQARDLNLQVHP